MNFSTAVLAGGQSTRMGRDKAMLKFPGDSRPLWIRQIDLLRTLSPRQILLSANSGQSFPSENPGVEAVVDRFAACGPMGGIVSCLERCLTDHLLVLAVDMPWMEVDVLRSLLGAVFPSGAGRPCGAVYHSGERFEPLAALYPRRSLPLATEFLVRKKNYRLQDWIHVVEERGMVRVLDLPEAMRPAFRSLNTPADLAQEDDPSDRVNA